MKLLPFIQADPEFVCTSRSCTYPFKNDTALELYHVWCPSAPVVFFDLLLASSACLFVLFLCFSAFLFGHYPIQVLQNASGMYRNLNSLAMQLTRRGGLLMTCSCSGAMTQSGTFLRILQASSIFLQHHHHENNTPPLPSFQIL